MGPNRVGGGIHKKTKRDRKKKNNEGGDSGKVDLNVLVRVQPHRSFDWWDDFSKRIAGKKTFFHLISLF